MIVIPAIVFKISPTDLLELLSNCCRLITVTTLPVSLCFLGYLFEVSITSSRDLPVVSHCAISLPLMMSAATTKIFFFINRNLLVTAPGKINGKIKAVSIYLPAFHPKAKYGL